MSFIPKVKVGRYWILNNFVLENSSKIQQSQKLNIFRVHT
jgi:hypothetical protein